MSTTSKMDEAITTVTKLRAYTSGTDRKNVDAAIAILKDVWKKESGCLLCMTRNGLKVTDKISLEILRGHYKTDEPIFLVMSIRLEMEARNIIVRIPINYCPRCGKQLKSEG